MVEQIWALRLVGKNKLVPPIEEGPYEVFIAFPTEEDALKGIETDIAKGYLEEGDAEVIRLK